MPRPLLLLALSRTPRLLLDLATPALAALLALGGFPSAGVTALGLLTAFAGYTAVYALNDLIDCRVDRETLAAGLPAAEGDLDSLLVRHPLAQGLLSRRAAVCWTVFWAGLAAAGAALLNPLCPLIFLAASLLEVVYCRLLRMTWLRGAISGIVKTSGPVAAVFAVVPEPSASFLAVLACWLFFWEIGGQNIPNDLSDLDSDQRIGARTVPLRFGTRAAFWICTAALAVAVTASLAIPAVAPGITGWGYPAGALAAGLYFLLLPCYRSQRKDDRRAALALFNRASAYPLAMLLVTFVEKAW
jgi:4-hydroxybenzoate polyprenyltransferase